MRPWRGGTAVALLMLVACNPGNTGSSPYNPFPAALAKWKDYPADQAPRPIVWLGNSSLVTRPSTNQAARTAVACGFFTLSTPLPQDYPAYGDATWPDGTSESYLNVPAGEALWALSRGEAGATAVGCGSATPVVLSSVRLGTFPFDTDRGKLQMSAWLFGGPALAGELAYPAITPMAFWNGGMSTNPYYQTVNVGENGRLLTMTFNSDLARCGTNGGQVAESASAVAIWLQPSSTNSRLCIPQPPTQSITVKLASPLGGRVVIDEVGRVMLACPMNFVGGC
jgi:hypothetical protein